MTAPVKQTPPRKRLPGVVETKTRGVQWKSSCYARVRKLWEAGKTAVEIARQLYVGRRKVEETVAKMNAEAGTRRARQKPARRRRDTLAAWLLVSVRSGGVGKRRAMNVKELNAFVAGTPLWRGTSYYATRRDALALQLRGRVVRAARREMTTRAVQRRTSRWGRGEKKAAEKQRARVR